MRVTIGLTDDRVNDHKYSLYEKWLTEMFASHRGRDAGRSGDTLRMIRLTAADGNGELAEECDGILLTGGGDVDPALYGGDPAHPTLTGVSSERDRFEIGVLQGSLRTGTPVLGICRGMQLANVALGGTLIVDLGEAGFDGHRPPKGGRCVHTVGLDSTSELRRVTGMDTGTVVSSHHQAVAKPGRGLRVTATSPDGVIEALGPDDAGGPGRLLLVQWHPEREENPREPLCGAPGALFFESISSRIHSNGKLT